MENKKIELSPDSLEQVTGGVFRTVNTGVDGLMAAVRNAPGKGNKQIASLANGTTVDTVTDELVYDPVSGRHFVQVYFTDKAGATRTGWIASSILGLKR